MLRKMGGRRRIPRKLILIVTIVLIIISILLFIENNLKPTIETIAKTRANLIAVEIINEAIYEDVLKSIKYNNLVNIQKDSQQRITLIQADSIQISRLISQTSLKIKDALSQLNNQTIDIPLGQALGSYIFAAYGPPIKVKLIPVGEVDVKLQQDFHEAGINQTRHILYLDVSVMMKIVVPMLSDNINVNTQLPIAETIIVGDVPSTLVRLEGIDGLLRGSLYKSFEQGE